MSKNIIFDFGNIFISLNTKRLKRDLFKMGVYVPKSKLFQIWHLYEKGEINDEEYLTRLNKCMLFGNKNKIKTMWEDLIGEFPQEKLDFLQEIKQKYRIFLLSNINQIHENHIKSKLNDDFYNTFLNSFEKAYYSHHIGMRKPDAKIFEFVLNENNLIPKETLFVDDLKENTDAAEKLGIKTWNLNPETENVINLRETLTKFN